jgi:hypothetical protein
MLAATVNFWIRIEAICYDNTTISDTYGSKIPKILAGLKPAKSTELGNPVSEKTYMFFGSKVSTIEQ